ncbi:MAG TPA: hypothetical protein VIX73_22940 [Kofleriaceae bacterium]
MGFVNCALDLRRQQITAAHLARVDPDVQAVITERSLQVARDRVVIGAVRQEDVTHVSSQPSGGGNKGWAPERWGSRQRGAPQCASASSPIGQDGTRKPIRQVTVPRIGIAEHVETTLASRRLMPLHVAT